MFARLPEGAGDPGRGYYAVDLGESEDLSDLFATAYEHGADLMLTGHEHLYERFAPLDPTGARDDEKGVPLFIVGTGGKSFYGDSEPHPASEVRIIEEYGVLRLALHPDRYDFGFHAAEGYEGEDSGIIDRR